MPAAGSPQGFRNSTPSRTRRSQATSLHCDESAVSPPTIASQRPRRPSLEILAICNRSQPSGASQQQVASLLGRAPRSYVNTWDLELPQWGTALPATYSWDANNGAGTSSTTITAAPAA
ncbi:hypothetical protein ACKKBF_B08760 [Auxenochlorella protothecoides x Auxenochlorella symbiontica]